MSYEAGTPLDANNDISHCYNYNNDNNDNNNNDSKWLDWLQYSAVSSKPNA